MATHLDTRRRRTAYLLSALSLAAGLLGACALPRTAPTAPPPPPPATATALPARAPQATTKSAPPAAVATTAVPDRSYEELLQALADLEGENDKADALADLEELLR